MVVKNLKLTNFRNFSKLDLDLDEITLLVGNNAQGKSNLLESIYFLATTKSFKTDPDLQLIKQGEQFCQAAGVVTGDEGEEVKLEIAMQIRPPEMSESRGGLEKRVKINGVPKRAYDYMGNLVAIHFSPEDINLVTGPPSLRRWHMDLALAQIDRQYKKALADYSAVITSRNRLLKRIKEGEAKVDELDYWSEQLVQAGEVLSEKRRAFFISLNEYAISLNKSSQSLGKFGFVYKENKISTSRLREYLPQEIAASASLIGPHRDDFIFELNSQNLAFFGSRGEQRIAVLELKLAELNFVSQTREITPVLLLDDVFSELDEDHREYVMKVIGNQQTILSAVEKDQIPQKFLKTLKVVEVEKGQVKPL